MTRAVYLVTVTLPPGMDPWRAEHEVRVSICFGAPQVEFVTLAEDRHDEQPDAVG